MSDNVSSAPTAATVLRRCRFYCWFKREMTQIESYFASIITPSPPSCIQHSLPIQMEGDGGGGRFDSKLQ